MINKGGVCVSYARVRCVLVLVVRLEHEAFALAGG